MSIRWTPRLRTVFITVNVLILLLPLGGIVLLRTYESVLIRRTENELIVQGAHVAAAYRLTVTEALEARGGESAGYGIPIHRDYARSDESFYPVESMLDLSLDPILPPPEAARTPRVPSDEVSRWAGDRITPALREAQRVTLAGIRVVDSQGVVVATTRSELTLSLAHREEVRRALRGEAVALMRQRISDDPAPPLDSISRGTQLRVFVAMPMVYRGRVWGAVLLSRTPQAVGQSLYNIRWFIIAGVLALMVMILLISALGSRTITHPMEELIRQTERIARGEKGAATPLANPGTLELSQVSEAIARMASSLEKRAEYISTFARGVSHEFKTPLASMRGATELLRDHLEEMTDEERDRFLSNLEQDIDRLTRLVSRLTDLARADVIKPRLENSKLEPIIEAIVERFKAHGLEIELRHDPEASSVRMAREILESLLTNLIDNARQHGGPEVKVTLTTHLKSPDTDEPEVIELAVEDDGPGISEANRTRVFDRFFTTARNHGGSGLGLSIVKTLVDVHGGKIELESEPGRTVFTVTLPSATATEERAHSA
jgi:signal transduction histidine kinase